MFDELDVLRTTLILTVLFFLAGLPFQLSIAMGFLLGGLIGFLAFRLLIIDARNLLNISARGLINGKEASRRQRRHFLKRCSLYAATIAASLLSPHLSFAATFAGLLLPRLAIICHLLLGRVRRGT
ncbi:MAG TPA: hypothetical protein GX521_05815 [Firmicutes bacterium]|nr:hypothetical protein [Bacillota bacterium]